MKYKKLTKDQIIISLDRLTRFKNTKIKYLRVFTDILLNNLIEPKLSKKYIEKKDFSEITSIACKIFNESVKSLTSCNISNKTCSKNIINILKDYENSVFKNEEETQKLLSNDIDYVSAISLIPDNCPLNLKWLKFIIKVQNNNVELRENNFLKYPLEKILLVEGITEETLLPVFAKYLGCNFDQKGIQIVTAGGKNQVVKMYYKLCEELKLPIYILLDKDAEENIRQITPKLRNKDKIHIVSCGEFEDILPKSLIIKSINNDFKNFLKITEDDLCPKEEEEKTPMAKILTELFRTKGLHEFKKAEFAKIVSENINSDSDISDEILNIINEIIN